MPKPKDDETEKDFVARCVPVVIEEGTAEDGKQAAAICHSMWREAQGDEEGKSMEMVKIGDKEYPADVLLRAFKAMGPDDESSLVRGAWYDKFDPSRRADAWVSKVLDKQVLVEDDGLLYLYDYEIDGESVTFGEAQRAHIVPMESSDGEGEKAVSIAPYAIKMLREEDGGVVVGGPMCLYADAEHKDLQGDYFTSETETWHEIYKSAPALFRPRPWRSRRSGSPIAL